MEEFIQVDSITTMWDRKGVQAAILELYLESILEILQWGEGSKAAIL